MHYVANMMLKEDIIFILYIVIFVFFGTYVREISLVYTRRQKCTDKFKMFIGTLIGIILTSGIKEYYLKGINVDSMQIILPAFMCGVLGYEVFTRIGSISDIKRLARDLREIVSILTEKHRHEEDEEDNERGHDRDDD